MPLSFDNIKKLHQKKYRQQLGYYLVEGEHLILELQKAAKHLPALAESELLTTEAYSNWDSSFNKRILSDKQMTQITDTQTPQGIMAVVPMTFAPLTGQHQRRIYLNEIQDPGNLGTILRTLAWFGGFHCLLSPNSVDPFNSKVVRASMGAIFHVPISLDVTLSEFTKQNNNVAYLDMQGTSVGDSAFLNYDAFVFGNEARGVPEQIKNQPNMHPFTIIGAGNIESLNLATAVSICSYQLSRS